jgi:predicted transcriptional regulator
MGVSTTGKTGVRSASFKLKPDLLIKISIIGAVKGQNNSQVVDQAIEAFIGTPENQELLRKELNSLLASS